MCLFDKVLFITKSEPILPICLICSPILGATISNLAIPSRFRVRTFGMVGSFAESSYSVIAQASLTATDH